MGVYTAIAFTEISTIKTSTEFNSVLYKKKRDENNREDEQQKRHPTHIYTPE